MTEYANFKEPFLATVLRDYFPKCRHELFLNLGDTINVLSVEPYYTETEGWWVGECKNRQIGVFPSSYVSLCSSKGSDNSLNTLTSNEPHEAGVKVHATTCRWLTSEEIVIVDKSVGSGAFGTVYRGRWHEKDVAIKTHHEASVEGELLSVLSHRNVVAFFGLCRFPQAPLTGLVMEFAHGGALNAVIERRLPQLDLSVVLTWALQVAEGMNYLHSSAHLIHGDLKPSNILIKEAIQDSEHFESLCRKTLLISDFGMSCRLEGSLMEATKFGTINYAAPETLKKETVSTKSDVWSFAILLWELLTLDQPFGGMEPVRVFCLVGLSGLTPHIPSPEVAFPTQMADLLSECWSKEQTDRPSFESLTERLQLMRQDLPCQHSSQHFSLLQQRWRENITHHNRREAVLFSFQPTSLRNPLFSKECSRSDMGAYPVVSTGRCKLSRRPAFGRADRMSLPEPPKFSTPRKYLSLPFDNYCQFSDENSPQISMVLKEDHIHEGNRLPIGQSNLERIQKLTVAMHGPKRHISSAGTVRWWKSVYRLRSRKTRPFSARAPSKRTGKRRHYQSSCTFPALSQPFDVAPHSDLTQQSPSTLGFALCSAFRIISCLPLLALPSRDLTSSPLDSNEVSSRANSSLDLRDTPSLTTVDGELKAFQNPFRRPVTNQRIGTFPLIYAPSQPHGGHCRTPHNKSEPRLTMLCQCREYSNPVAVSQDAYLKVLQDGYLANIYPRSLSAHLKLPLPHHGRQFPRPLKHSPK